MAKQHYYRVELPEGAAAYFGIGPNDYWVFDGDEQLLSKREAATLLDDLRGQFPEAELVQIPE